MYFDQQTHACACVRIVENDQKHLEMSKKHQNSKWYNQLLGVDQLLGVTPNRWPTIFFICFSWFFFVSLLSASRVHDEKGTFSSYSNVFCCYRPCEHMRKHAFAGRNTQHTGQGLFKWAYLTKWWLFDKGDYPLSLSFSSSPKFQTFKQSNNWVVSTKQGRT